MAQRYEDVSETVMEMFRKVKSQYFAELKNAKIRVLFDLKKRKIRWSGCGRPYFEVE